MSNSTGVIFNNEMDDFSVAGSSDGYGLAASLVNLVRPGRRPVSSMSPTIVLDKDNNVRLVSHFEWKQKWSKSVAKVA
jgi:gamma-glutamyltranspeptidase